MTIKSTVTELREVVKGMSATVHKGTIPVLNAIHFADGKVEATDLDTVTRCTMERHFDTVATIPLDAIKKFLTGLPAHGVVTINALPCDPDAEDVPRFEICHDVTSYKVDGFAESDWPLMVEHDMRDALTFVESDLLRTLNMTGACMSDEETRYYLRGVCMTPDSSAYGRDTFAFVATDGHKLARVTTDIDYDGPQVILPDAAVNVARKLLSKKSEADASLAIAKDGLRVSMTFGRWQIVSKVIDGTFPDYTRVIPTHGNAFHVDASILEKTAARYNALGFDRIDFDFAGDELSTQKPGESAATLCELSSDADFIAGFNAKYIATIAKQAQEFAGKLRGHVSSAGDPAVFTAGAAEIVVMPMRR